MAWEAWGNYVSNAGSNQWRVGIRVTQIGNTDDRATFKVEGLVWTKYSHKVYSNGSIWDSSDGSQSYSGSLRQGNNATTVFTSYENWFGRVDGSSRTVTFYARYQVTGGYNNGTSTAQVSVTVDPKRKHPPSAPGMPTVARSGMNLTASWDVVATNATGCRIQRQKSGDSSTAQVYDGAVKSSHTENPGAGAFRYRVQNYNGDGDSSWGAWSAYVQAQAPPAAPTLASPASGTTLDSAAGSAALTWAHNPVDGSAQTAAQLQWSNDQTQWNTVDVSGSAQSYALAVAANADYYWRVRTKGSYDGEGAAENAWSPWSATGYFKARTAPSVAVHAVEVLEEMPLAVSWDYNDATGAQSSATVRLAVEGGAAFEKRFEGAATACEVAAGEFMPPNGSTLTVAVTAVSTTGLSGSGSASLRVDYEEPAAPSLRIAIDPLRLACEVAVYAGGGEDKPETASLSLYRDGAQLASGLKPGALWTDCLPPLDVEVRYRAVAVAQSGATSEAELPVTVESRGFAAFNWGASWSQCVRLGLSPGYSVEVEVEKETFEAAAYEQPVASYGTHRQASGSVSATVPNRGAGCDSIAEFRELMGYAGAVAVRYPGDGGRYHADVACSVGTYGARHSQVSVDWEETAYDGVL